MYSLMYFQLFEYMKVSQYFKEFHSSINFCMTRTCSGERCCPWASCLIYKLVYFFFKNPNTFMTNTTVREFQRVCLILLTIHSFILKKLWFRDFCKITSSTPFVSEMKYWDPRDLQFSAREKKQIGKHKAKKKSIKKKKIEKILNTYILLHAYN